MEIDSEIYDWLTNLQILVNTTAAPPETNRKGQVIVRDEDYCRELMTGILHKQVLLRLCDINPGSQGVKQVRTELFKINNSTSEPAKLHNWDVLAKVTPVFPGFNIPQSAIDDAMKGNSRPPIDIVSQIYSVCQFKGKTLYLEKGTLSSSDAKARKGDGLENKSAADTEKNKSRLDISHLYPASVTQNISRLSSKSGFEECANCLELFCLGISKVTDMKPMQAVPLFNDNNKNWSLLVTKGMGGDHRPIIAFFKSILEQMLVLQHLIKIEEEKGSVDFVLEGLKPGLLSKDLRVASLTCSCFTGVLKDINERGSADKAWAFFKKIYGGFLAAMTCFDTFGDQILPDVYGMFDQIGRYSLIKMFREEFRRMLPDPVAYAKFVCNMLTIFYRNDRTISKMMKEGVVDHLIKFSIDGLEHTNQRHIDEHIISMVSLVSAHMLSIPTYFISRVETSEHLFSLISSVFHYSPLVLVHCLTQLSSWLKVLSKTKSALAASVLKLMIKIQQASLGSATLRSFASEIMMKTLAEVPAIPADCIADVVLDWMFESEDDEEMDHGCFQLLFVCIAHETISPGHCKKVLHLLKSIIQKSRYFSALWCQLLRQTYKRWPSDLVKASVSVISSMMARLYGIVSDSRQQSTGIVVMHDRDDTGDQISRFAVVHACHQLLSIGQQTDKSLCDASLSMLLYTNDKIKKLQGSNNKGVMVLLRYCCNDPERVVNEYARKSVNDSSDKRSIVSKEQFSTEVEELGLGKVSDRKESAIKNTPLVESSADDDNRLAKQRVPDLVVDNYDKSMYGQDSSSKRKGKLIKKNNGKPISSAKDKNDTFDYDVEESIDKVLGKSKSEKSIPGYMKGTEPEKLDKKLKYQLKQQIKEQQEEAKQRARQIRFDQRSKELKAYLRQSAESGLVKKVRGTAEQSLTTVETSSAFLPGFPLPINVKEDLKKEKKRQERHKILKQQVEAKKLEIMTKKQTDTELEHQMKQKELIAKKMQRSREFIKSRVKEIDETNKKTMFLLMFKQEYEQVREQAKKAVADKRVEKIQDKFTKVRDKITNDKLEREKILNLLHSEGTKAILKMNKDVIQTIFEYFSQIDYERRDLGIVYGEQRMQCRTFFEFLNIFGIIPGVCTVDEVHLIYRDTTRGQMVKWIDEHKQKQELPIAITLHQFEELLLRISVKKKEVFAKEAYDNKPDEVKVEYPCKTEFKNFAGDQFFTKELKKKLEEKTDIYETKDYHFSNFEGMFNYLRMPSDKVYMPKKLKFIRRDYMQRLKPEKLKKRPQSVRFNKIRDRNDPIREQKIEDAITSLFDSVGQSQNAKLRLESAKTMRDEVLAEVKKDREKKKIMQKSINDEIIEEKAAYGDGGSTSERKTLVVKDRQPSAKNVKSRSNIDEEMSVDFKKIKGEKTAKLESKLENQSLKSIAEGDEGKNKKKKSKK